MKKIYKFDLKEIDYCPTHPGKHLWDIMQEYKLDISKLSKKIKISKKNIKRLIDKKTSMSIDLALRLAKLFGISENYWLNLQQNYDLWKRYQVIKKDLKKIKKLERF